MNKKIFLIIILSALMTATLPAQRIFTVNITPDGESTLTAYLPAAPCGKAIVACPGGGYSRLAMSHEGTDWAPFFNDQGIAYFVLKYRMPHGDRAIPVSDAEKALQTVRDSAAAWRINPSDVGIMGSSAGGHLACTIATHSDINSRPNFQLLFYPVITMEEKNTHKGSVVNFLGDNRGDAALVKEYSNEKNVGRDTPPALILLSSDDRAVPPLTNGVAYYEAMVKAGRSAALMAYPTGGHGWGFRTAFAYHEQVLDEIKGWLGKTQPITIEEHLNGKSIAFIGDSYVANHQRPKYEGWQFKFAKKYGMRYYNYGRNGNCVAYDRPRVDVGMYKRYKDIADSMDYIVIIAGHNDATRLDSVISLKDYKSRLTEMLKGLKAKEPQARILFISPWNCKNFEGSKRQRVIDATAKVCKKLKVPFLDAAREGTIKADDDAFRAKYFQRPQDTAHLNAAGHDLFLPVAERFILENIK